MVDWRKTLACSISVVLVLELFLICSNTTINAQTQNNPEIYSGIANHYEKITGMLVERLETISFDSPSSQVSVVSSLVESNFFAISSAASTLTASLSESASSLYFGNMVNFTVTVQGGTSPYSYVCYVDNQLMQTASSPYYSIGSLGVGEHHVYAIVTDADSNSATTLAVAFDVLPNPSSSPLPSPSPSVPEFPALTFLPLIVAAAVGVLAYLAKRRTLQP